MESIHNITVTDPPFMSKNKSEESKMSSSTNDKGNTNINNTIESIGLYSNSKKSTQACATTADNTSNSRNDNNDETEVVVLPVVLRQLVAKGYQPGDPCPLSVLNSVDNMNYYGAQASLDMLGEIQSRFNDADANKALMIGDVGSGFGGTARVMLSSLNNTKNMSNNGNGNDPSKETSKCKAYCFELQKDIHDTAMVLADMACKDSVIVSSNNNNINNNLERDQLIHVQGNAVTGQFAKGEDGFDGDASKLQGSFNVLVSRLVVLHIAVEERMQLFERLGSWCQTGAVLAIEDYAASDTVALTPKASELLRTNVYVPNGALPTISEYKSTLEACGFHKVEIQDCTASWAKFVSQRYQEATDGDARKEQFDKEMGGSGRREFFSAVNQLFNPSGADAPNGLVGVKIYAVKK
jgi:hypothetical protein